MEWIKIRWQQFKIKAKPYMTPKMLLVFGVVWLLTTGWAHVFLIVGTFYNIGWMYKIGIGAEVFFFNPFVNEKLITIPFSIWLYKKTFKEEVKTNDKKKISE